MNKLKQIFMFAVLATLCLTATAAAQDGRRMRAAPPRRTSIRMSRSPLSSLQADVKITPEELKALTDSVVKELQDIARHHPPPRTIELYESPRVGGRVHAVVGRLSLKNKMAVCRLTNH